MNRHVEIGGREIPLRYTVNAMCAMEERSGGALDHVLDRQFTATRLLLWGGMLDGEPTATLDEAGQLLGRHLAGGGSLSAVVDACAAAMEDAGLFRSAEA